MAEHTLVICTSNAGYEASLELRKLYELVPDQQAEKHDQVRIIDGSGEDYLYPATFFTRINLPASLVERVLQAA